VHTSAEIDLTDFVFRSPMQHSDKGFSALCADYHNRDRSAVISTYWEEGILGAGRSLLAMTASFYQSLRADDTPFFDYPQHFVLLGTQEGNICVRQHRSLSKAEATTPWSALDVWPESQWRFCVPEPSVLLYEIFALQINRLFWPEGLIASAGQSTLPSHVRKLLRARLQSVYYYGAAEPDLEISTAHAADDFWRKSVAHLGVISSDIEPRDRLRCVTPEEFLGDFAACFADE
jgi:hypothetical protein